MQTLTQIKALLAERGIRPKHRLGQNFLHDQNQIRKLIDAAALQSGELVLEVGPGTGALTQSLIEAGAEVLCCEIDRDLAAIMSDLFGDQITLIEGDCLDKGRALNPRVLEAIDGRAFKLIANLPYQAASPLMATLVTEYPQCNGQFVTIQKEVADRLMAGPGTKAYGPLGIIVQGFASVELIGTLSPGCFWPQPKVTSAMVSIEPTGGNSDMERRSAFARFVTHLFSKRRKQLGTVFGREVNWPEGVAPQMRGEQLDVTQLKALCRAASVHCPPE